MSDEKKTHKDDFPFEVDFEGFDSSKSIIASNSHKRFKFFRCTRTLFFLSSTCPMSVNAWKLSFVFEINSSKRSRSAFFFVSRTKRDHLRHSLAIACRRRNSLFKFQLFSSTGRGKSNWNGRNEQNGAASLQSHFVFPSQFICPFTARFFALEWRMRDIMRTAANYHFVLTFFCLFVSLKCAKACYPHTAIERRTLLGRKITFPYMVNAIVFDYMFQTHHIGDLDDTTSSKCRWHKNFSSSHSPVESASVELLLLLLFIMYICHTYEKGYFFLAPETSFNQNV